MIERFKLLKVVCICGFFQIQGMEKQVLRLRDQCINEAMKLDERTLFASSDRLPEDCWREILIRKIKLKLLPWTINKSTGRINTERKASQVAMSADGTKALAVDSFDQSVRVIDLENKRVITKLPDHKLYHSDEHCQTKVAICADGSKAISGYYKNFSMWDLVSETDYVRVAHKKVKGRVWAVAISGNGAKAISTLTEGEIIVWDTLTKSIVATLGYAETVISVAINFDGTKAISTSSGGNAVRIWDLKNYREIIALPYSTYFSLVAINAEGTKALSDHKNIRVWNLEDYLDVITLRNENFINSLAMTADGAMGVCSSWHNNTITIWDLVNYKQIAELQCDNKCGGQIAINFDGTRLISNSDDRTVEMWDLRPLFIERLNSVLLKAIFKQLYIEKKTREQCYQFIANELVKEKISRSSWIDLLFNRFVNKLFSSVFDYLEG